MTCSRRDTLETVRRIRVVKLERKNMRSWGEGWNGPGRPVSQDVGVPWKSVPKILWRRLPNLSQCQCHAVYRPVENQNSLQMFWRPVLVQPCSLYRISIDYKKIDTEFGGYLDFASRTFLSSTRSTLSWYAFMVKTNPFDYKIVLWSARTAFTYKWDVDDTCLFFSSYKSGTIRFESM